VLASQRRTVSLSVRMNPCAHLLYRILTLCRSLHPLSSFSFPPHPPPQCVWGGGVGWRMSGHHKRNPHLCHVGWVMLSRLLGSLSKAAYILQPLRSILFKFWSHSLVLVHMRLQAALQGMHALLRIRKHTLLLPYLLHAQNHQNKVP
jgi:hypothetical protein